MTFTTQITYRLAKAASIYKSIVCCLFGYVLLSGASLIAAEESKPDSAADKKAFSKAESEATWQEVFFDSCKVDWKDGWFLDGLIGSVTNNQEGMTLNAGPEFRNDSHHMVLWTKDNFVGDLKIDYEYTRLDKASNCVTILYIQATGSGIGPHVEDISKWNQLREIPAMKMYYNHMNTYHISYAANPGTAKAYIRGRRYMPEKPGLKGTELEPDYATPELFATGVKHKITVIKKDRDLFMRVENPDQVVYCHMPNKKLPEITQGRIGLRHMFTRSARYANFRVSLPRVGVEASQNGKLGTPGSELPEHPDQTKVLRSDVKSTNLFSNGEIARFRAGCRAAQSSFRIPVR